MTVQGRNEAAERLRSVMVLFSPDDLPMFEEALAAERRATEAAR